MLLEVAAHFTDVADNESDSIDTANDTGNVSLIFPPLEFPSLAFPSLIFLPLHFLLSCSPHSGDIHRLRHHLWCWAATPL